MTLVKESQKLLPDFLLVGAGVVFKFTTILIIIVNTNPLIH